MTESPTSQWADLEAALHYVFQDHRRLEEALTHASSLNERRGGEPRRDNERLEFLGDAVLDLIVSEALVERDPAATEGALSKMRARLVSETALAQAARRLGLGRFLRLGRGEELSGGRDKSSLLADAFEAVVAAVYHDGGYDAARRSVLTVLAPELTAESTSGGIDYKTQFQEYCQQRFGQLPVYRVTRESGPDHQKVFQIELTINGLPCGQGTGKSKKEAEQQAAQKALESLHEETGTSS
ncbi:MAG: ribonuclease III [Nitrospirae bacterium]|nr:ribonuclease III [Nitrospirota bacterium]